jgi:signal transduction histidine kinase
MPNVPANDPAQKAADQNSTATDIAKTLYERGLELATRNKTLSLLRKLYQLSILTLEPNMTAARIAEAVQQDLEFELVGILTIDPSGKDALVPLEFAASPRLTAACQKLGLKSFSAIPITNAHSRPVLNAALKEKKVGVAVDLGAVWDGEIDPASLKKLTTEVRIKACLVYPLALDEKLIGVMIICLNRTHEQLSRFENDSLENLINVVALALDRAFLYQQIQASNRQLKVLNQQKSDFIKVASHDLKSPVALIKQWASAILDGTFSKPDEIRMKLEKIKTTADRSIQAVDDVLDITKIDEGRIEYDLQKTDLIPLLKEMTDDHASRARAEKGIDMHVSAQSVATAPVRIDVIRIRQVFQNLLDNSYKYTEKGSIVVTVTEEQKSFLVSVKDTGLGMSKELLPVLFEQFRRDPSVAKKIQGTGLGLFISKQFVLGHGGEIWAESAGKGTGSAFFVRLPKAA